MKWVLTVAYRMMYHCYAFEGPEYQEKGNRLGAHHFEVISSCAHGHESPLVVWLKEVLAECTGHGYAHRQG